MSDPAAPTASARRIGLFGGSFDPVHNAHVALARLALEQLSLDELWWLPTGSPWQKQWKPAPAEHRVAMIRLVIEGEPRFRLEPVELDRAGPSYTIDTVRELAARHPGCEWFLVLGQDQYANLHTWHGWQALLGLVTLAVAARSGADARPNEQLAGVPHRVVWLEFPVMAESSTDVRQSLAQPGPSVVGVERMVPPPVARYIARHRLYTRKA